MYKRALFALGLTAGAASVCAADNPQDLKAVLQELKELKASNAAYQQRISTLENRLQTLETKSASTATAAAPAAPAASADVPQTSGQSSPAAFNPAISLILEGSYHYSPDGPRAVPGVLSADKVSGPKERGFSLSESELTLSANVDPYFFAVGNISIEPDGNVGIEEGYFQTLGLGHGFTLKGGRFFSGIGYMNEIHQHAWDFYDAPLAYQALLGTEAGGNHGEDGLQLRWLAPLDHFLEFGAEVGRGRDFPDSDRNVNGIGSRALFVHFGGDVGVSHSYRVGASWLNTDPRDRESPVLGALGKDYDTAFSGSSNVWIGDFVYKYAPNGDTYYRNFKLQGEVLYRDEHGNLDFDPNGIANTDAYSAGNLGGYVQAVYQFEPRWRAGLRGEWLHTQHLSVASNDAYLARDGEDPIKTSAMVDYSPSEFSRIRLQFSHQKLVNDNDDNQAFVQYIYSLGSHGAHQY